MLHAWRFCPRCAGPLDCSNAPLRVECNACGFVGYANSSPCVCALVEDARGRILLSRRAIEPDELPGDDELAFTLLPAVFAAWKAA